VEVLDLAVAYQGYFRIDRYRLRHRLHDGGWSEPFAREVFECGQAVGVLLYDPDRDRLVLIEQFRIGAYAVNKAPEIEGRFDPWMLEVVAGIIDAGESAEAVARREAVEEAGCEVGEMFRVCRFVLTPGVSSETITLFCGRVRAPEHEGVHGLDDEHEDIRVRVVSSAEIFAWLDRGCITNATALIALQWFRLNRDALRSRWLGQAADG
jgi:ADP-ribose pyrophosphatase